ncbi:hypothetical protein FQB35_04550 [Crassaminicella thermophila]|uniref:Phage gp6-like head-tail connector protein n=1 Tax=Crassaminicella thermophila TaxID=2599308 RepID=A0A5C0SC45_CRATE|nr:phage head-tail connector protein [Crassaminicella thermophila]QEK11690.1 hypothetical protein FQB35_04550 [Crassaminicella thermophila]
MLEEIKRLLGYTSIEYDIVIDHYINGVTQKILNYCNISELPKELEHVVVEKVVAIMKDEKSVKTVTRGDTTITYQDGEIDLIDNIKSQLNRFRKVKFV